MIEPPTPHPVVVHWEGPSSEAAIRLGGIFGAALDQPVLLATTIEHLSADDLQRAGQHLGVRIGLEQRSIGTMDLGRNLRELAQEVDASMLVVQRSQQHRHAVPLTVHHAPCPIAVAAWTSDRDEPWQRIGVAYDDSDASRTAVRVARRLAAALDATVQLICVGRDVGAWPALIEAGAALNVDVAPLRLTGDPVGQIVRAAGEVDLLVCGTHGRGALGSLLLGSVSTALMHDCPSHLLVVPAPVRRKGAPPLGVSTAAT